MRPDNLLLQCARMARRSGQVQLTCQKGRQQLRPQFTERQSYSPKVPFSPPLRVEGVDRSPTSRNFYPRGSNERQPHSKFLFRVLLSVEIKLVLGRAPRPLSGIDADRANNQAPSSRLRATAAGKSVRPSGLMNLQASRRMEKRCNPEVKRLISSLAPIVQGWVKPAFQSYGH
jgi:hypothetical protein